MKLLFMLPFISLLLPALSAQTLADRQERFDACLSANEVLQRQLQKSQRLYQEELAGIRTAVDRLIVDHAVQVQGDLLSVENLKSAVELSMQLRDLDAESDSVYFQLRESVLSEAWTEGICAEELSFFQYQELMDNYLEDVIRPVDCYAASYFSSSLGFRSMRMIQLQAEEDWLVRQGAILSGPHPFDEVPVSEDMYWAILNTDWDINLRRPEASLLDLQLSAKSGGVEEKMKFKEILQFIFDNWDDIKDILNWLDDHVFYDCSPTVTARIKSDTRDVNVMQLLSPDVERRIYYQVGQRGVRADFRSTRTRIYGKAHLYKRKRNRFVKDKTQVVGVGYCTQQWNVCEDRPWPSNRQPFQFAGVHRRGKAKFSERHPYALAIQETNGEFINFPLFYNRALVDQVFLLGSGGCF